MEPTVGVPTAKTEKRYFLETNLFRHLSTRQKRLVDFLEVKTDWIDENSRRWLIQDHSRANREPLPTQNRVPFPNLFPNNNSNGFNDQSTKKPATILVPNTYSDQEVVSMLSAQAGFQIVAARMRAF